MSQDYAENKLNIYVSKYLPVSPGADEELGSAIGRVDLSWRCLGLGPYKQMATFHIAPNATFDVLFGRETESLQKGRFSWDTAIRNGAMRSVKSNKGGESHVLKSDTGSGKSKRQPSCLSFEQGITNGILVPVDAEIDEADEAGLRPSIAELQEFYFSEGIVRGSQGETLRATDDPRPNQIFHSFKDRKLQQSRRNLSSKFNSNACDLPADAAQIKVEQWFVKCGESQVLLDEGADDCIPIESTINFVAAERNTEVKPFSALSVGHLGEKGRRHSEEEESTSKRRRSGFIENSRFEIPNVGAPGSPSTAPSTKSTQQKLLDGVSNPGNNSLLPEPRPNETIQVTTKTLPHRLARDLSLNPQITRKPDDRFSRLDNLLDNYSNRRLSSDVLDFSTIYRMETQDVAPNYRFEPYLLPSSNAADAKITGSNSSQRQPHPSAYRLEQSSLTEALASLEYPQSPVSRRQSSPTVPRSHHDWTIQDLHRRTGSIPGIVTGVDKEESTYSDRWDFSQDARQAYHIRSLSGNYLSKDHPTLLTNVGNTIKSADSAKSPTENPEITPP
jgi:hypothetical protein